MPESFSSSQNDRMFSSTFLEDLDEDLATLVKRHNLGWLCNVYQGSHYTGWPTFQNS